MTREQIRLIQHSFGQLPADGTGRLFYGRLFELRPDLRGLFPADLEAQERKLTAVLSFAATGLGQLEIIVPALQELGRRHVGYGATRADYDAVGTVLLDTLESALGSEFTDAVEQAWTEAYALLSGTMIDAAERQAA